MSVTGFSVPNEADLIAAGVGATQALAMSELDELDFRMMTEGWVDTGVIYGCAVSVSSAMTLAVAIGAVESLTVPANVAAGNVTIGTAHATLPRFDLVVASAAGVKSVVAGVAAANPIFPSYAAGSIVLAAVYVRAATTSIVAADIKDKRAFVKPSLYVNVVTYGGAKGDDSTDDAAAFTNTIAACPAGGAVVVPKPPVRYRITTQIAVAQGVTIQGIGMPEIHQVTAATRGFYVTAGSVYIRGLKLTGHGSASYNDSARAIEFAGGNSTTALVDTGVSGCIIDGWEGYGVLARYLNNFRWTHNTVRNICRAAMQGRSVLNGEIGLNLVTDVNGTGAGGNCYGIIVTRDTNISDDLSLQDRSRYVTITMNVVKNIPIWEGLDTHGGVSITFSSNVVYGCKIAINAGGTANVAGNGYVGCQNIVIIGNACDSGVTDGSYAEGIRLSGVSSATGLANVIDFSTGQIIGNTVKGYGTESSGDSAAVYLHDTEGAIVSLNQIYAPSPTGINFYYNNSGFSCSSNTFVDYWTNSLSLAVGIGCSSVSNTGTCLGNTDRRGAKSATHVLNRAYSITTDATNTFEIIPGYTEAAAVIVGNRGFTNLRGPIGQGGSVIKNIYHLSTAYNPGSIADGATVTASGITVTGASVGDTVIVSHDALTVVGAYFWGTVTATNTVAVTLFNKTGGAYDLPAGNLHIVVLHF